MVEDYDPMMDEMRLDPWGRPSYYVLDKNHDPAPATLRQWAMFFEDHISRRVREDTVGDIWVSTVFLGMDHSFGDGPPLLFETMCFRVKPDGDKDYSSEDGMPEMRRYSTWAEAVQGHEEIVKELRFFQFLDGQVNDQT